MEARMDGGYSCAVAIACFVINFITSGMSRAAGVLYVALIDAYGVSREVASTPFSIRFSVRNMSGPLVGLLGQKYGIRAITLAGGVLAGIGGALCAVAPDTFWIIVLWGGVHGLGYGLCNLIHILILNQYFEKYKATALGFVLSGDCFGTFAFPSILEFLLQNYGVNGTFLILGGLSLNVLPAGLLLKANNLVKGTKKVSKERSLSSSGITNPAFISDIIPFSNDYPIDQERTQSKSFRTFEEKSAFLHLKNSRSASDSLRSNKDKTSDHSEETKKNYICPPNIIAEKTSTLQCITYDKQVCNLKYHNDFYTAADSKICDEIQQRAISDTVKYTNRLNSSTDFPLRDFDQHKNETPSRHFSLCIIKEPHSSKNKEPSVLLQFFITNTRPMFLLTAITLGTYYYLFLAVITIIFDYTLDVGIPAELGKYLIIGFSVTDLFGKLCVGVILDRKWIKPSHFTGLSTALMGIFVIAIPFCANFYYIMVCMALYGYVQGANAVIYPILVEEYMEKKEESVALGCLNSYGGLMLIPLASMIGYFRDVIGSYDGVFYCAGGLCLIAGIMWTMEPCIWKFQQKNSRKA